MAATKEQELQALKKIKDIIEEIGGDESYIGMAFEGCFEIAESNIENDFGDSMKDKKEAAERKAEENRKSGECFAEECKKIKAELDVEKKKNEKLTNDVGILRQAALPAGLSISIQTLLSEMIRDKTNELLDVAMSFADADPDELEDLQGKAHDCKNYIKKYKDIHTRLGSIKAI